VEPVEQVGVALQPGRVALDQVEGEPAVGDHLVPVGHQVVLGHRGQPGQVGLLEAVGVDPGQPLAVPGRGRPGHPEQVAQAVPPLLAQPVGRRRRSYRVTAEGRAALAAWLTEPTDEPLQVRSLGLLKLYFAQHAGLEDVAELAGAQARLHRQWVETTNGIIERLKARGDRPGQLAVAELMGDAFRVMAGHWERIEQAAAAPPAPAADPRGR
jgi:hypothetical protein